MTTHLIRDGAPFPLPTTITRRPSEAEMAAARVRRRLAAAYLTRAGAWDVAAALGVEPDWGWA